MRAAPAAAVAPATEQHRHPPQHEPAQRKGASPPLSIRVNDATRLGEARRLRRANREEVPARWARSSPAPARVASSHVARPAGQRSPLAARCARRRRACRPRRRPGRRGRSQRRVTTRCSSLPSRGGRRRPRRRPATGRRGWCRRKTRGRARSGHGASAHSRADPPSRRIAAALRRSATFRSPEPSWYIVYHNLRAEASGSRAPQARDHRRGRAAHREGRPLVGDVPRGRSRGGRLRQARCSTTSARRTSCCSRRSAMWRSAR